jgi:hypothetical protein
MVRKNSNLNKKNYVFVAILKLAAGNTLACSIFLNLYFDCNTSHCRPLNNFACSLYGEVPGDHAVRRKSDYRRRAVLAKAESQPEKSIGGRTNKCWLKVVGAVVGCSKCCVLQNLSVYMCTHREHLAAHKREERNNPEHITRAHGAEKAVC